MTSSTGSENHHPRRTWDEQGSDHPCPVPWKRANVAHSTLSQARAPMTQPSAPSIPVTPSYHPRSDRDSGLPAEPMREWTLAERFGFRVLVAYVVLYTFPGPINELPGTDFITSPYGTLWRTVVPWFGAHVLRLANPISIRPSGSGDKLFDWVAIVTMLTIAIVAAT